VAIERVWLPVLCAAALLAGCGGDGDAKAATTKPGAGKAIDEHSKPAPSASAARPVSIHRSSMDSILPPPGTALTRESFAYSGGTRDPFVSLLTTARNGPELPDLILVGIYYDTRTPTNSVVVLRERVTNKRYSVRMGDRLGRMRIADVRPRTVTFSIDDFGTERQETLSLRTKEVETP
jgi:hypothetical protein